MLNADLPITFGQWPLKIYFIQLVFRHNNNKKKRFDRRKTSLVSITRDVNDHTVSVINAYRTFASVICRRALQVLGVYTRKVTNALSVSRHPFNIVWFYSEVGEKSPWTKITRNLLGTSVKIMLGRFLCTYKKNIIFFL